jgi:hypothetical protein
MPGRNGGTLNRLEKGETANPNGRPKKLPVLDQLVADILGDEKDGITAAEAIFKKLRQEAIKGNLKAAEMLLDRAYGKPKQAVEHSGPQGGEIQVKNIIIEIPKDGGDE